MNIALRVFLALVFCGVAIVAGRFIAHTVAPSGATAHGYIVDSPAPVDATAISSLHSPTPALAATPLVLSPRPTRSLILPSTQSISTQSTSRPTVSSSTSSLATSTRVPSAIPSSTSVLVATSGGAYFAYTVKKGDTLIDIAKSFNTSVKAILASNTIDNSDALKIGQVIHIPAPK